MHSRSTEAIGRVALTVLDRIKATAKNRGEDAQLLILRYALQRWLHRLSVSPHADTFVIKGGMMMPLLGAGTRPTEDIDGHSHLELSLDQAKAVLRAVCDTPPTEEDGVVFYADTMKIDAIRDGVMPGFRASLGAALRPLNGRPTEMRIKVDLCFGDIITPDPIFADIPSAVKGFGPVRIAVYPWPTVVAEKLHALARHGFATTRMKDLYDLVLISRSVPINGLEMSSAISNTFRQWGDQSPSSVTSILTADFALAKSRDWAGFLKRKGANTLDMPNLGTVIAEISEFAAPAIEAAENGHDINADWLPGEGWGQTPLVNPAMV